MLQNSQKHKLLMRDLHRKSSWKRSKQAMQMIHFLLSQAAAGNSLRVLACGGIRIAHYMCQRVELSESSASVMYMITPIQGM